MKTINAKNSEMAEIRLRIFLSSIDDPSCNEYSEVNEDLVSDFSRKFLQSDLYSRTK